VNVRLNVIFLSWKERMNIGFARSIPSATMLFINNYPGFFGFGDPSDRTTREAVAKEVLLARSSQ
jgi:hypothetical protein